MSSQNIVRIGWVAAMVAGIILVVFGIGSAGPVGCMCGPGPCQCDEPATTLALVYAGIGAALAGVTTAVLDFSGRLQRAQV